MSDIFFVGDEFRSSHLSFTPGGSIVSVVHSNAPTKVYDKIKYPIQYANTVLSSNDPTIIEIRINDKTYWKKN